MRKYYINYYKDFANTYDLRYTEGDEQPAEGYERITLAEARRLASREASRRKDDPAFSGFASAVIVPMSATEDDLYNISRRARGWDVVDHVAVRRG